MRTQTGISLVEFLVVLSILGIIMALLLPAVQNARERARETVCKNNIHQINVALMHYYDVHKRLPSPSRPGKIGGWTIEVLPYLEQQATWQLVESNLPIEVAPESVLNPPSIFRCPRRTGYEQITRDTLTSGHYVFVPEKDRESYRLYDAPLDIRVPWLSSPEMSKAVLTSMKGPHSGGFFFVYGMSQGYGAVDFYDPAIDNW